MKDIRISRCDYSVNGEKLGDLAVFFYVGQGDPKLGLNSAVKKFTKGKRYHELLDANLDNPWMRVIISDINVIPQKEFDEENDRMDVINK